MSTSRRSAVAILTLLLTAVFSSFAWPEDKQPHSLRAEVSGRGRPMILSPGLASSGETWKTAVIRDRHLDRPIIAGHSLGGSLVLAVAADHPEAVGPLVIVDMVPFLGDPDAVEKMRGFDDN
jgi:pimeloyl-ACP methyl ester carboxylesterase